MHPNLSFPTPPHRPEIHGHRGCRGLRPENTLPAFLHALTLGVEVLELDVVVSADHQVVVSHEPWLSARLGTGPDGEQIDPHCERTYNIFRLPYATIRRCVVGAQALAHFPEQQLIPSYRPLLSEVLQATETACQQLGRAPIRYAVELKSDPAGDELFHPKPTPFVELVAAELLAAGVQSRTTLLSFDPRILQAARAHSSSIALCLLNETAVPASILFEQLGFVPDTYGPEFDLLSFATLQALANSYPGLRIVPWTVNTPSKLELAIKWGVAGITTDYPNLLQALLAKKVS